MACRMTIVLPHLGLGGAQRVAVSLAAHWAGLDRDVTMVTWLDQPPDFYALDGRVHRIQVGEKRGLLTRVVRYVARHGDRTAAGGTQPPGPRRVREGGEIVDGMLVVAKWVYLLLWRYLNEEARMTLLARVTRRRLLGPFGYPYARLLRLSLWRVRELRRVFRRTRPDVVVSLLGGTNIITVAASAGLRHRTIISERNDPSKQKLGSPWEELRPVLYSLADVVTANSLGALDAMRGWCTEAQLRYAPNPLQIECGADDQRRSNSMLFLARLVRQKAPDVLIEAFARFVREVPGWRLDLVGEGPLANELRQRVAALGIADRVTFHGALPHPAPQLSRSRIFVLPSRFEGTPNALLEAMANGLACIVTDASPGPLALVADGRSGLVVKTDRVDCLTDAMVRLARDSRLRQTLGQAALERVREFGVERVSEVWDRFLFPSGGRLAERDG